MKISKSQSAPDNTLYSLKKKDSGHLKKMRIFIFKITLSQCNFLYHATGIQNDFSTKRKTAANSLARGFLKLNLMIPLINF